MKSVKFIREENNRLSKKLSKEYQAIYLDAICYLRVSDLSDIEQEEVSSDVLRMFFDWEKQGKSVKDMIGEDYKQFFDDIITAINPHKSIPQQVKEYGLFVIEALGYMLTIDFIILYLPKILKGDFSLFYSYSLDMAIRELLIFIIMLYIITYIGKNSFRLTKRPISKPIRFIIGCCVGAFIVLLIALSTFPEVILVTINICFIIAILAFFWTFKAIRKILSMKYTKLNKQSM